MHRFPTQAVTGTYRSPLGPMTLLASDSALLGAWFEGQQHHPALGLFTKRPGHAILAQACEALESYFFQRGNAFTVPLDLASGTAFQQAVWLRLRAIPTSTTTSYTAVAHAIGKPAAVRAVGAAIGRNPLSIFVPCHRVIGSNGQLTGYAGGLPRKIALLQLESAL